MLIVAASPLSKIFDPKWHQILMNNPDKLYSNTEPFSLVVPRSSGSISLTYNRPLRLAELKQFKDKSADAQTASDWLVGNIARNETDKFGIVEIDLETSANRFVENNAEESAIRMELTQLKQIKPEDLTEKQRERGLKLERELDRIEKEAFQQFKEYRSSTPKIFQKAKDDADIKVMGVLKRLVNNMKKQMEENKALNLGDYTAAPTEYMAAFILKKHLEQMNDSRKVMNEQTREAIDLISKAVAL